MGNEMTPQDVSKLIGLSEYSKEVVGPLDEDYQCLGQRLNTICERYGMIMARDSVELTVGEWCAIIDTKKGTFEFDYCFNDHHFGLSLGFELLEADHFEDISGKHGIDAKALATRLEKLPYAQLCSILEVVSRFWQDNTCQSSSIKHQLEAAGARLAPDKPVLTTLAVVSFGL